MHLRGCVPSRVPPKKQLSVILFFVFARAESALQTLNPFLFVLSSAEYALKKCRIDTFPRKWKNVHYTLRSQMSRKRACYGKEPGVGSCMYPEELRNLPGSSSSSTLVSSLSFCVAFVSRLSASLCRRCCCSLLAIVLSLFCSSESSSASSSSSSCSSLLMFVSFCLGILF